MSERSATPVQLPEQFGPYRILRPLGKGGMGTVYLAHDTRLGRDVALKVCHLDPAHADALDRFRREARAAASLRHPNLCPVHEYDERDGIAYLTMDFIEGQTLAARLKERGVPGPRAAAALVARLARAMQEAHDNGVIHRDLKPANIGFDRKDEPIVLDFGLAKQLVGGQPLTRLGTMLGTPAYMAPEQIRGDSARLTPACDVYSLGVVLYELLTGKVPFDGQAQEILARALSHPPEPPSHRNAAVDGRLEAICLQTLAKRPEERLATMQELATALEEYVRTALPDDVPTIPLQAAAAPLTTVAPVPTGRTFGRGRLLQVLVASLLVGGIALCVYLARSSKSSPDGINSSVGAKQPATFENSVGMRMIYLEPGSFLMGSPETEYKRAKAGEELHRVTLTKGFHLAATPVTQKQWREVMGTACNCLFTGDDLPVHNSVNWDDAQEFCRKLSERERRVYRLPTEAEWEYACRAGTTTPFWCGETLTPEQANFDSSTPYRDNENLTRGQSKMTPVTRFPPNPWGFYDMHSNVRQWCSDGWKNYRNQDVVDPEGNPAATRKVIRGSAYSSPGAQCRSAMRSHNDPTAAHYTIGFRVACDATTTPP